jgi:hypothetical protein
MLRWMQNEMFTFEVDSKIAIARTLSYTGTLKISTNQRFPPIISFFIGALQGRRAQWATLFR